jgi:hypothetical protein
LVDPKLCGDVSLEEVENCKIACWCIEDMDSDRPAMGEVVQILKGPRKDFKPAKAMPKISLFTERYTFFKFWLNFAKFGVYDEYRKIQKKS